MNIYIYIYIYIHRDIEACQYFNTWIYRQASRDVDFRIFCPPMNGKQTSTNTVLLRVANSGLFGNVKRVYIHILSASEMCRHVWHFSLSSP